MHQEYLVSNNDLARKIMRERERERERKKSRQQMNYL